VRPEADSHKIRLALETGSSHPAVRGNGVDVGGKSLLQEMEIEKEHVMK